jgi:glutamate/tyrosine decarboxylase-like PLP-dependent enzyme
MGFGGAAPGKLVKEGRPAGEVLDELRAMQGDDTDFRAGRTFGLVYHPNDPELEALLVEASSLFTFHNGLNPDAFPSLRRMQAEVVATTAALLGGGPDDDLAGFMTSGGTESILMAVKAAKVRAATERDEHTPNIVLPLSAHAAFAKACEYFGLESRRTAVDSDFRADVDAMAAAVDDHTVLVVGSAPSYPQGVVDPIPAIAALALDRGVNCHVDACMGGFVLPFLERLGRFSKPWDFRVPGVTSMSADLHKYGYTPKGASVVMHRSKALRRYQTFTFDGWLGGFYGSSGVAGTKPGAPIAAAWAALQFLGEDGYLRLTAAAHDAALALVAGVRATPGLTVLGEPEMTLAAIASEGDVDVFAVHDGLRARGWYLDRQGPPDSLHVTVHAGHAGGVVDEFLADLAAIVGELGAQRTDDRSTTYAALE